MDVAYDGVEALRKAEAHPYDAVTLNLGLPASTARRCAGTCTRTHRTRPTPAAARRAARHRARRRGGARGEGLDPAADDYLVKPLAFPELPAAASARCCAARR